MDTHILRALAMRRDRLPALLLVCARRTLLAEVGLDGSFFVRIYRTFITEIV